MSDKLLPILKEYDLTSVLMALSFRLEGAVAIAAKASSINEDLQIALEYGTAREISTP